MARTKGNADDQTAFRADEDVNGVTLSARNGQPAIDGSLQAKRLSEFSAEPDQTRITARKGRFPKDTICLWFDQNASDAARGINRMMSHFEEKPKQASGYQTQWE